LHSLSLLFTDTPDYEVRALVNGLLRWAHIASGITWIGMLYFFNFVNVPFQGKLDGPTKKMVNPELMPRALWWFRWFVIWPAQKILIKATKEGQKPPEHLPPRAKLFSRINTILSAPMLVCMVAANNQMAFKGLQVGVSFLFSLLVIHLAIRASNKVGASI